MKVNKFTLIKKIPRFTCYVIQMFFYHFISVFYKQKEKYRDAWLICERGKEARDNGYWLFKYIREKYPEKKVYYIIDSNAKMDYEKVVKLGNIVQFGSFEHKMAIIFSKIYISTHIGYIMNWNYLLYKKLFDIKNRKRYVFLQHGITIADISNIINKQINQIDLIITATIEERQSIIKNPNYGYKEEEVALTGMARYDNLNNFKLKEQILLMPTWRNYLVSPSYKNEKKDCEKIFLQSKYYKVYKSLLNNNKLYELLNTYNLKLIFYPHYEMQKYLHHFKVDNNILIASKDNVDIQSLLKESKILITDYSSVYFDFAYMQKPEIFYQFDKKEFNNKQYKSDECQYEKRAFGKVIEEEEEVLEELERLLKNNCEMDEKYKKRVEKTFAYKDNQNCKRIYEEIIKLER